MSEAIDLQRIADARVEYVCAYSRFVMASLNHSLKESGKLLFWYGTQFEASLNEDGSNQLQILFMIEVPTEEMIQRRYP